MSILEQQVYSRDRMNKALTVLHTESSLELGGREMAVLDLVRGLRNLGHRALLGIQAGSALEQLASRRRIPCQTLPMSKWTLPASVQRVRSLIRQQEIDVIHTHSSRDRWITSLAARLSPRRPVVIHGRHHCGAIRNSFLNRWLYRRLSDCLVTTGGERLRAELICQGISPSRVIAIPTSVDLARFDPTVDGTAIRMEWNVPPDAYLVGAVSFLRNYKGLEYFVEAAGLVHSKVPVARFVIVGDGPERARLAACIRQAGLSDAVLMTGHRDDIPRVMAAVDLCVVSSTGTETLTQVIPQAFAIGKPVVATEVGGIPDIVVHQVTGFLIPPHDSRSLAEAILWYHAHPEEGRVLAESGRRLVTNRYSRELSVRRTERLYLDLLENATQAMI
jgi:glycosyltransferase involved in cell wall biosynthesis